MIKKSLQVLNYDPYKSKYELNSEIGQYQSRLKSKKSNLGGLNVQFKKYPSQETKDLIAHEKKEIRQYENKIRRNKKAIKKGRLKHFEALRKESKRKTKGFWAIFGLVRRNLDDIKDPLKAQEFKKKYHFILKYEQIYTPFEQSLLGGLKKQKVLRQKNYKFIHMYKNKGLHLSEKYFIDFELGRFMHDRQMFFSEEYGPYAKNLFLIKSLFRFFYGRVKSKVVRKAFYSSRFKSDRILNFLNFFEARLITVICRLGFAWSVLQAKQMIKHGFISVNRRIVKFPEFKTEAGDFISISPLRFIKTFQPKNLRFKKEEIDFLYNNVEVELSHLYSKHRIHLGTILYNPSHTDQLLFSQKPNYFFGKDQVDFDDRVSFDQKGQKRNTIERLTAHKLFDDKTLKQAGPFVAFNLDKYKEVNDRIPEQNIYTWYGKYLKI